MEKTVLRLGVPFVVDEVDLVSYRLLTCIERSISMAMIVEQ